MANRTTILEEAFNLEVPIRLPPTEPPRLGLDATIYCRYHRSIGHNTKDCWALKDKIKELIHVGYLTQFFKRPDNHQAGARPGGHQEEQHRNHDADRRIDRTEDQGKQRHQQHRRERKPPQEHESVQQIIGVINTIAGGFSYGR